MLLIVSSGFGGITPARAEDPNALCEQLSAEVQTLRVDQQALLRELSEIKKRLAAVESSRPGRRKSSLGARDIELTLNITDAPKKGSSGARVTLIEFTDFRCAFCGRHALNVMPRIEKNFVANGKLRYVVRDFPLDPHDNAASAHQAAHCASEQDRYWEMHGLLFANQKSLRADKLPQYADAAGVSDLAAFQDCMDKARYAKRIQQGLDQGSAAHIRATPSFVLGLSEPDGTTIRATKFIRGAMSYAVFQRTIEELLAAADD